MSDKISESFLINPKPFFFITCTSDSPSLSMKAVLKIIKTFTIVKIHSTRFIIQLQMGNYIVPIMICVSTNSQSGTQLSKTVLIDYFISQL